MHIIEFLTSEIASILPNKNVILVIYRLERYRLECLDCRVSLVLLSELSLPVGSLAYNHT